MDFTLNEEQEMLKKSAQDFLKNECGPKVLKELEESETGFSRKLWESMAGLGWMGIIVPEAYDGVGLTLLDLAVLFEAYGRAALNGPMLGTVIGTMAILEGGSEDGKAERLPQVVSGQRVWTFAMEEAEVAYDPGCVATRAVSTDKGYKIQGTKLFVPYANVADDLFVVARTEGSAVDEGEVAIFVVNKDAPGIQLSALKPMAGDKQFQVDFQDVPVSPEDRLGAGGGGSNRYFPSSERPPLSSVQRWWVAPSMNWKSRQNIAGPGSSSTAPSGRSRRSSIDWQTCTWTCWGHA